MTGGEILLECLKAQGVRAVFGMPGTQNLAIYDAFHRVGGDIEHVLVRNEQAASMMAGGYARATGQMGVALTVPGPGASNASTGVADAYIDCQPVLLITGGVEREAQWRDRSKMFHGLDQESFFRPIVRYYGCPQSAAQIPQLVRAAMAAMWSGRPGPAVLEIPPDVAAEEGGNPPIPERIAPRFDQVPNPAEVRRAVELVRESARPLVLVGGDAIASGAGPAVERLASRLGAPVLHTRLGKGAVPTAFGLNLGHCRNACGSELLDASDVLIAIGVRFTQIDTSDWQMPMPDRLIQLDRQPGEIGREYPVQAGVTGDLVPSIDALMDELGSDDGSDHGGGGWGDRLEPIREKHRRASGPVLTELREVLDSTGLLVSDVTSLSYRAFDEYPIYGPRDFIYPCHYVTMGYGLPAALGAKVACPDRQVVAICGDGGVLMSIGELATAAQHKIGAVIVVVTDGHLLAIKGSQMKHYGGRLFATQLANPDFLALAQSFGVAGHRADDLTHFKTLLADALASGGPALIEVPMKDRQTEIIEQIPWLYD